MSTESLLNVLKLSVDVPGKRLLNDISFEVNPGELIAVIGPNGAGKSSLLKAVVGDLTARYTDIQLNGRDLLTLADSDRAQQLAYLPQSSGLSFPFTVTEVVALGRLPHASGRHADSKIVNEALSYCDIAHLAHDNYLQLSGGEKQRVQLARVFAQIWQTEFQQSRLLILDEPFSAIDIAHKLQLVEHLQKLKSTGVGIVMVVHDFQFTAQHADRVLALKNGECVVFDRTENVMNTETLKKIFDVSLNIIAHPVTGKPIIYS